jgi:proline dehydrogenase
VSITRSLLLRASRSRWLADQFRRRAFARRAVRRFMPGEDLGAALDAGAKFATDGIGTVLTNLGERVSTRAEAVAVHEHYRSVLSLIRERGLRAQISVKLSHLGIDVDRATCSDGLRALVALAAETGSFVWIDMEESRYVDATLEIYRRAHAEYEAVGICLQAYLARTPTDIDGLLAVAPSIRLVKGAYREPASIAFPGKRDVDAAFKRLGDRLLKQTGPSRGTPAFGTHDLRMIDSLRASATAMGVAPKAFEIHMLYGIKTAEQRALARTGVSVRVLISYGAQWFPWYMRRLAERPANLWFVARNMVP